ncbi:hypothetical protein TCAL_15160 [Tigriopus californicus]|uniref:Uncharacterized protein n=1 Tax=Tigriopus californicus TaxID=6832 RepID=A0A553NU40_TIGCA|nr:hypothetical protein TCAL_15160 [Tigriopus californicus]
MPPLNQRGKKLTECTKLERSSEQAKEEVFKEVKVCHWLGEIIQLLLQRPRTCIGKYRLLAEMKGCFEAKATTRTEELSRNIEDTFLFLNRTQFGVQVVPLGPCPTHKAKEGPQ